jgi:sarcosine oxidase subunit alpha
MSETSAAGQTIHFTFGDRNIPALPGQSIAAALYAAGVRVFSRSFKYHRPRGLLCVAGDCPNCQMQVDGRPNVRTCVEPVRHGQVVVPQNAWPSLEFDVLRVFDHCARWLPVGFYYKRFHKPAWLWPLYEHALRNIAGIGRVDVHALPEMHADVEHLHVEVCVIGGGPAGLAATTEAAAAGVSVVLLDRETRLGGHLLFDGNQLGQVEPFLAALACNPRVRLLSGATAFGVFEGSLVGAFQGQRLLKVRAQQIIVCTGGRQRPFVFHNNDLPGIFLGDGVLRLARLHGVTAGRRAVIYTDNDSGSHLAAQLAALGMEVVALVDRRGHKVSEPPKKKGKREKRRAEERWPVLGSSVLLGARGDMHLKAVRIAQVKPGGALVPGSERTLACDLLCLAPMPVPANELLLQGGMRFRHDKGRWFPERAVAGLFAAGLAAGTGELSRQVLEGRLRGAEAATAVGHKVGTLDTLRRDWEARRGGSPAVTFDCLLPPTSDHDRKRFVCLCEDVTDKDLAQAVAEGFDNIETLKRYSTVNMGPCQGKMCGQAASAACARATGRDVSAVGMTTSRPPAVPVELGVLAAGHHYHPVRRTPLHHWHEAAGASWLDAGLWRRPEHYGDPVAEVRAARNAVGLIDVSTLGKLEVIGPDAAELLERVTLNKWADLAVGRARYAVLCDEDGILFDDGVGARLAADRFYLTATTGNAEAVFQWLELWKVTWGLDVTVLNQTSAMAAMNLAGPRSREVLGQLTALDLTTAAFPYMALREGEAANVPCRLWRIGFVGETGYEIHCPSSRALQLWEALMQAGANAGLRPFGVEAQRILRLEKGHLIIGQDTDALSNPLEAGLAGLVRFEKPLFHGREPLLTLRQRGLRSRLVGFYTAERDRVPLEGCQVVEQGRPAGRVTSARYSPTLERALGLAWLPAPRATVGERFAIRCNDTDMAAVVAPLPFYDPEGKRLKS